MDDLYRYIDCLPSLCQESTAILSQTILGKHETPQGGPGGPLSGWQHIGVLLQHGGFIVAAYVGHVTCSKQYALFIREFEAGLVTLGFT